MLWNQPPTSLCSVDTVNIDNYLDIYYICSGECRSSYYRCASIGEVVGTRNLTCDGVGGKS